MSASPSPGERLGLEHKGSTLPLAQRCKLAVACFARLAEAEQALSSRRAARALRWEHSYLARVPPSRGHPELGPAQASTDISSDALAVGPVTVNLSTSTTSGADGNDTLTRIQ
jgi:hypothetical protein